jgi:hypothetical protein
MSPTNVEQMGATALFCTARQLAGLNHTSPKSSTIAQPRSHDIARLQIAVME